MMWFFAILVVLVLGGIAAVASGRGTPLAPAAHDRPDPQVGGTDGTAPVTAGELRRVRFSLAVRGYRMDEVDALLRRLADQLEDTGPRRAEGWGTPPAEQTGAHPDEG